MVWLEGVGGGVPLGEVVETDEREENERESEKRVSWHPGKMDGRRLSSCTAENG